MHFKSQQLTEGAQEAAGCEVFYLAWYLSGHLVTAGRNLVVRTVGPVPRGASFVSQVVADAVCAETNSFISSLGSQ